MISAVAELYDIHPQTLRMYEREGLLRPNRSEGNTRLYSALDLERLELILTLTRDLGVNLAGVDVILNMRENMSRPSRSVPKMNNVPSSDGQTKWKSISTMPQNSYSSPEQKNLTGSTRSILVV